MVLKEKLADVIGEQFSGLFDNLEGRERVIKTSPRFKQGGVKANLSPMLQNV